MNALETKLQIWSDYKGQCASADGLPEFDDYVAYQVWSLRQQLAALTAERGKLRDALEPFADAANELEDGYRTVLRWGMMGDLRSLSVTTDDLLNARAALADAPDAE
jgi:hypothetical protein